MTNRVPIASAKREGERGAASLVALGILLSRIAGLVRERVFAHYFGSSVTAGAFKAAIRIPNALQNLFGEGVLSGSFIPVYAKLLGKKEDELADRVAGVVASFLAILISVVVLVGVLASGFLVTLIAPGFTGEARELTVSLVRILFPGMGLLVLSAWCLGVLNSHRKFLVSYSAPVLWSLSMIGAMVIWGGRVDVSELAVVLAWGTVVGSALQLGIQLPFVYRSARRIRFGLDRSLEPVRRVFTNAVPIIFSRGVVQISAFVDEVIGSFLGAQVLAGLAYAQTLYLLPVGLFGMSVAAAELPEMSRATGSDEEIAAKLRDRLTVAQRQVAFLVIPSLVAFLTIGVFLVSGLFETGAFGREETIYVTYVLSGSTIGLLAVTMGRLYSSAFYSMGDTRTPLRFAIYRLVTAASLGVVFAFPLRPWLVLFIRDSMGLPIPAVENPELAMGAIGITIGSATAGWVECVLLRRALFARIGNVPIGASILARIWIAAFVAGGVGAFFGYTFVEELRNAVTDTLGLNRVAAALVIASVFGLTYLLVAWALRLDQLKKFLRR